MIVDIINIVFTNHQSDHSWKKESYIEEIHKEGVVSSRRALGYLMLVIRRKWGNILHDVVFFHTAAVAEEIHFIYLLLILRLQFLLLSCKTRL